MAETQLNLSASAASRAETVLSKEWIGEYEIIRRIQGGGMATVFLGRKHGLAGFSRRAAIKVIHPHLERNGSFAQMFANEACLCSHISHPNVIHVEAFGKDQKGRLYMAMEYVDGCTLKDVLRSLYVNRRRLPPKLGSHIALQVAAGLHAAHETHDSNGRPLDIIHRDISPANILLSLDGQIKVIDFGIAKSKGQLASSDEHKSLQGKFRYMAPEQGRADCYLDRRADIFSLGIVLWELLVGRPLFTKSREIAIRKRLKSPSIPRPSEANPAVPKALDDLVMRMLEEDRERRPCTASEVRREIIDALPSAANRQLEEISELSRMCVERSGDDLEAINRASRVSGRAGKVPARAEKVPALRALPNLEKAFSAASSAASEDKSGSSEAPEQPEPPDNEPGSEEDASLPQPERKRPWFKRGGVVQFLLLVIAVSLGILFFIRRSPVVRDIKVTTDEAPRAKNPNAALATRATHKTFAQSSLASEIQGVPLGTPSVVVASDAAVLSVSTQTNAEILLNGKVVGTTAIIDHRLAPGPYQIEVRLAGYQSFRRKIAVKPSESFVLNTPLEPLAKGTRPRNKGQGRVGEKGSRTKSRQEHGRTREQTQSTRTSRAAMPAVMVKRAKARCGTPFYFESGKKVFKPACL